MKLAAALIQLLLFADGFESGDSIVWTSTHQGGTVEVGTDFREYPLGEAPEDWTPVILSDTDAIITRHPGKSVDSNRLLVWRESAGISGLAWDVLDGSGPDVEYLVHASTPPDAPGAATFLAGVRVSGSGGDETGALLQLDRSGATASFQLRVLVDGFVHSTTGPWVKTASVSGGSWWARIKVWDDSGTTFANVKFWQNGPAGEPVAWDEEDVVIATGSALPATGAVALMADVNQGDVVYHAFGVRVDD